MNNLFDKIFTIEEARFSTLVLCLLSTLTFALIKYGTNGDISSNLVEIIKWLIIAVASINIASSLSDAVSSINSLNNNIKNENQNI